MDLTVDGTLVLPGQELRKASNASSKSVLGQGHGDSSHGCPKENPPLAAMQLFWTGQEGTWGGGPGEARDSWSPCWFPISE